MNRLKSASTKKKQKGDMLMEAMIGMVLMGIIGMGIVHVSSRTAVAQHDMRLQEIAVNQMRAMLIRNKMGALDLCTAVPGITLPDGSDLQPLAQGCVGTTTATIGGTDVQVPKPIVLSVTLPPVGDQVEGYQVVVGGTWDSI